MPINSIKINVLVRIKTVKYELFKTCVVVGRFQTILLQVFLCQELVRSLGP